MLTKKQKDVLTYLQTYMREQGHAPSLEEIKEYFKLASVSTAHYYIKKLQAGGFLTKASNQPRALVLESEAPIESPFMQIAPDSITIPVVGSANCGPAELVAQENVEGYLKISRGILSILNERDGVFAVRAEGDSMNKADIAGKNIEEGDFVIIDSGVQDAKDGDYVLSLIDGCANLKRFKVDEEREQIMLVSESTNPDHKPIFISSEDDFMINGKIIGVVKK